MAARRSFAKAGQLDVQALRRGVLMVRANGDRVRCEWAVRPPEPVDALADPVATADEYRDTARKLYEEKLNPLPPLGLMPRTEEDHIDLDALRRLTLAANDGRGAYVKFGARECPDCKGSGVYVGAGFYAQETCRTCGGKGVV